MHGNTVPLVKKAIRASSLAACERLAADALAAPSADAVRALMADAEA